MTGAATNACQPPGSSTWPTPGSRSRRGAATTMVHGRTAASRAVPLQRSRGTTSARTVHPTR